MLLFFKKRLDKATISCYNVFCQLNVALMEGEQMRKWLKNLRNQHKYSQQNVAEYLGITRQYYRLIETGERQKDLNLSLINKIAELFNVSVEYIVEQESKEQEGENDVESYL